MNAMRLDLEAKKNAHPALRRLLTVATLRRVVQFAIAAMLVVAGYHFHLFVESVRFGGPEVLRPPVAEGFLPIAALVAFKAFIATGLIDTVHPAGLMIFVATILTAWVFRRALCSWICPIGALSEQLAHAGKRLFGRHLTVPGWLDVALLSLKYALLLFIVRMLVLMPASEAMDFMRLPFYAVSDIRMFDFFMNISATGVVIISALVLLSMPIKSLWCRYLCPYGALLGVIGLVSPIILARNDGVCAHCGACEKACPNGVRLMRKKGVVASAECIGCTSCVSACPKDGALTYRLFGVLPVTPPVFALGFLMLFFGVIALAKLTGHWDTVLALDDYRTLDRIMAQGAGGF